MRVIKYILLISVLLAELLICTVMGGNPDLVGKTVKYYLISHGALALILLIVFNVVPLISVPELTLEPVDRTFKDNLRRWGIIIAYALVGLPVVYVFVAVSGAWKAIPVLMIIINSVICGALIALRRIKTNTAFAYTILKLASKDRKQASKVLLSNPDVLDVMIGFLPFGFVAQFGLERVKDKVLVIKKRGGTVSEEDLNEVSKELSGEKVEIPAEIEAELQ